VIERTDARAIDFGRLDGGGHREIHGAARGRAAPGAVVPS
jgi:hypothetical protein